VGKVIEIRVRLTAEGAPVAFKEITASLVHPDGPAQTPQEFLMKAFLRAKDAAVCVTAAQAKELVEAAIEEEFAGAVAVSSGIMPSELAAELGQRGTCSVLDCASCTTQDDCTGVTGGACTYQDDTCTFSFINGEVTAELQTQMLKRVSTLGGSLETTAGDCLSSDTNAASIINGVSGTLDPSTSRELTDENGVATFTLMTREGMSGNYGVSFKVGKLSAKSKAFTLINEVGSSTFTRFDGVPSSSCNGWRVRDSDAANCGYKKDFPLIVPLPEIRLSATNVEGSQYCENVGACPVSTVRLSVSDKYPQRQLSFDELVEKARDHSVEAQNQDPVETVTAAVNLIVEGSKLLQPPGKEVVATNAYLRQRGNANSTNRPAGQSNGWTGSFDDDTKEWVFKDMEMVTAAAGEYVLRAYTFGIASAPSEQSVVVEMFDTKTWEYQTMMWIEKLIMFALFASVFIGNSAFDNDGRWDWNMLISLVMSGVILGWLNFQYHADGSAWKDKEGLYILLLCDLILIIFILLGLMVFTRTSLGHKVQHVNIRKRTFYAYAKRMFDSTANAEQWYHGWLNSPTRNEFSAMCTEYMTNMQQQIEATNKALAKIEDEDSAEYQNAKACKKDAEQTIELCTELQQRLEQYGAEGLDAEVSETQRVQARFLAETSKASTSAFLEATAAGRPTSRLIVQYANEHNSILHLNGLPDYLFDFRRDATVAEIYKRARAVSLGKQLKYSHQLKKCFQNVFGPNLDAFFFPSRLCISASISMMIFCMTCIKFASIARDTKHSMGTLRNKTSNTISTFLVLTPCNSCTSREQSFWHGRIDLPRSHTDLLLGGTRAGTNGDSVL
jgi:hypothetical protein